MARITKPLTNTEIDKSKPKDKDYTLSDGLGLYLLIKSTGAKLWRFNYYKPFTKNRTEISLGSFPTIQLAEARAIREEYRALVALVAKGVDPKAHREQQQQILSEFIYTLNLAQIHLQTLYLILWQLLTMTRPNEAATARYEDIDESTRIWTIYIQKGIKENDKGRVHKLPYLVKPLSLTA